MATTLEQVRQNVASFNERWHVNFNLDQYMRDIKTNAPDEVYLNHLKRLFREAGQNLAEIENFDVEYFYTEFFQNVIHSFAVYARGGADVANKRGPAVEEFVNRLPHAHGGLKKEELLDLFNNEIIAMEDGELLTARQAAYAKREIRNRDMRRSARQNITGNGDANDLQARQEAAASVVALRRAHEAHPRWWIVLHLPTYLAEVRTANEIEGLLIDRTSNLNALADTLAEMRQINADNATQIKGQIAARRNPQYDYFASVINPSQTIREAQEQMRREKELEGKTAAERSRYIVDAPEFQAEISDKFYAILQERCAKSNMQPMMQEAFNQTLNGDMLADFKELAYMVSVTYDEQKDLPVLDEKIQSDIGLFFGAAFRHTASFGLPLKDRLVMAQQMLDVALKEATPIGYVDSFKKYTENYILKSCEELARQTVKDFTIGEYDEDDIFLGVVDARDDLEISKKIEIPEVKDELTNVKAEPIKEQEVLEINGVNKA